MTDQKFNIIGLGEILWDIYESQKFLGGAPANFAIHCSQLGDHGIVLSRIGKDELGDEIIRALRSRNIETEYLQIDQEKPTGTVDVALDEHGKPTFTCHEGVAFDYLQADESSELLVKNTHAILFGSLAQRNSIAKRAIQKLISLADNGIAVFDINIRGWDEHTRQVVLDSLRMADIVKMNDDEIKILKSELASNYSDADFLKKLVYDFHLKLAALTSGENGCMLTNGETIVSENGIKVNVVDTTGCGDAFAAGMINKFLRSAALEEIAIFANAVGAFVATFKGATPFYSKDEIEDFMRKQKIL